MEVRRRDFNNTAEKVSRFQRLFKSAVGYCQDGYPRSQKFNSFQYPWIDNGLMVTGPIVVEL